MNGQEALEVYKACLQHTIKLFFFFAGFFLIFCFLFGYHIYKSYDVVPSTITATQGIKAAAKAQKQSIKIQPGEPNGRSKKGNR